MENIFGWSALELSRMFLERDLCIMKEVSRGTKTWQDEKCSICASIRKNSTVPVASVVEVPEMS